MLEAIYDVYREHGRWPIFQYVEAVLYNEHGLDAQIVLLDCPAVDRMSYGWFWTSDGHFSVRPGMVVGLTVAGMTRLEQAAGDVRLFLKVLAYLAEKERSFEPSPFEVQVVTVSSADLRRDLNQPGESETWRPEELDKIAELLKSEPSTRHGVPNPNEADEWTYTLSPLLRRFVGVADPVDYLERVTAWIDTPRREEPAVPSHRWRCPRRSITSTPSGGFTSRPRCSASGGPSRPPSSPIPAGSPMSSTLGSARSVASSIIFACLEQPMIRSFTS